MKMLSILKNYSILYVEDEIEIRNNFVEYLESYFSMVYVASDGLEAILLYEQHHPDVLLLDINLPHVDGLSVAKEIRKVDKSVKIIMLTAFTDTDKLLRATELKLTKYLVKPINLKRFKETLQLLVNELILTAPDLIFFGKDCTWNEREQTLCVSGKAVQLTDKESELLKLFLSKKEKMVTFIDIMLTLWSDAYEREISIGSVKNQVYLLRKKLPEGCIVGIYGKGYRLKK